MVVAFDDLLENWFTAGGRGPVGGKFIIAEVAILSPPNNAAEGSEWYTVIFEDTEEFDLGQYV